MSLHAPDAGRSVTPQPAASWRRRRRLATARSNVIEIETNPFQPRRDFDEAAIAELAESFAAHGLLQPLLVRRAGERLSTGGRRAAPAGAIKPAGPKCRSKVREADDRQMAEIAIVENLQRKDLNPLEKAASFDALS